MFCQNFDPHSCSLQAAAVHTSHGAMGMPNPFMKCTADWRWLHFIIGPFSTRNWQQPQRRYCASISYTNRGCGSCLKYDMENIPPLAPHIYTSTIIDDTNISNPHSLSSSKHDSSQITNYITSSFKFHNKVIISSGAYQSELFQHLIP